MLYQFEFSLEIRNTKRTHRILCPNLSLKNSRHSHYHQQDLNSLLDHSLLIMHLKNCEMWQRQLCQITLAYSSVVLQAVLKEEAPVPILTLYFSAVRISHHPTFTFRCTALVAFSSLVINKGQQDQVDHR